MTDKNFNPSLDLIFERNSSLSAAEIWKGWTHPETLMKWFCPKPWQATECRTDLRPGGEFFTVMSGPDGQIMANAGCYLEVVENQKLVWTNMMTQGYRPSPEASLGFSFVAFILLSKTSEGTLYQAIVRHRDEEGRRQHEQMGFQEGWGKAYDQLVELAKKQGGL